MRFSGAVLAGGASRRMGTDKALLKIAGEPLWQRQHRILRGAGAEPVILVRRPDQAVLWGDGPAPEGLGLALDAFSEAGPLAGLHAALASSDASWCAILAVDMPGIESSWFGWLAESCGPALGAMVRHAKAFEPLAAIYPREALPEILARLHRNELSLQRLAESLATAGLMTILPLPESGLAQVRSWNQR